MGRRVVGKKRAVLATCKILFLSRKQTARWILSVFHYPEIIPAGPIRALCRLIFPFSGLFQNPVFALSLQKPYTFTHFFQTRCFLVIHAKRGIFLRVIKR